MINSKKYNPIVIESYKNESLTPTLSDTPGRDQTYTKYTLNVAICTGIQVHRYLLHICCIQETPHRQLPGLMVWRIFTTRGCLG
jgi:hypothetical protein